MKCRVHPHSTEEKARTCYTKYIQRRLDRRLGRGAQGLMYTGYKQIKCDPPELVKLGNVEVYYFYKGVSK